MKAETFAPNPYGDQDKGWALVSVCWAFIICAFITTCLRVWVRARLTRNLGWDDVVMMIAMATTVIGAGLITAEAINGLGRHMFYLTASQRRLFGVLGWADWIQSFITLGLTKISICLFLLRIVESKKLVIGLHALIGVTALFTAVCVFMFIGVCRPLKAYWDVGVNGKCLSNPQFEAVVISQGVLSIITDLICAALPAIFLRNLQINKRTKIGLCVLMGLGGITAVCCIVRTSLSGGVIDPDLTWAISSNVAWRLPEVNIGIVCANAPVLRSLYLFFRGRLQSPRATSATAASKDRIFPSNNARNGRLAQSASPTSGMWNHGSEDTTVEMEMGLPINGSGSQEGSARWESELPVSPVLERPLKEKPSLTLSDGRQ